MGADQSRQHNPVNPIDPYTVLDVPHNCTWEQLKDAYKRAALYAHPDKPTGSHEVFNLVTECFKKLALELKEREANKPHYELKQQSKDFYTSTYGATAAAGGAPIPAINPLENPDAFNQFFDKHRFEDEENSHGYGDKMAASTKAREDFKYKKIFSTRKFDPSKFNDVFEKEVKPSENSTAVIKYREPEALSLSNKIAYTELGGSKPDDYSSPVDSRQSLQYSDYMKAHNTTRLVDPRTIEERREYKNIKEYERARERAVKKTATDEELAYIAEQTRAKEAAENERLRRLNTYDNRLKEHHDRLLQLTIGWNASS